MTKVTRTEVVVPPCELAILRAAFGELRLADELVCLLVEAVVEVVAQEKGEERRLEVSVVAKGGGTVGSEEDAAG